MEYITHIDSMYTNIYRRPDSHRISEYNTRAIRKSGKFNVESGGMIAG